MQTIQLRFKDEAYPQVIEALKQLGDIDLEIINFDQNYEANRKFLQEELDKINSGEAEFISLEELDARMDKVIEKYENKAHEKL